MNRLLIDPRFPPALAELKLDTFAAIVDFFNEGAPPPPKDSVTVKPRTLRLRDDSLLAVYYKQYDYAAPAWRYLGRRSKPRCEYDNYAVFARLGLAAPARVACGEARDPFGRLRRAFIITQAIPDAQSLASFLDRAGPATRRAVTRQLADMVRRMHAANFFHHDLVWRNILVTIDPAGEPQLWWIDCPRGSFVRGPFARRRRQLKDLASLDKSAAHHASRTERLRFLLAYRDQRRLDPAGKTLSRAVQSYRQQRWPEDWPGLRPAR